MHGSEYASKSLLLHSNFYCIEKKITFLVHHLEEARRNPFHILTRKLAVNPTVCMGYGASVRLGWEQAKLPPLDSACPLTTQGSQGGTPGAPPQLQL